METQKYEFVGYYKYQFTVKGEDGKFYEQEDESCNADDIYRFDISSNGEMTKEDGDWYIDGIKFV